MRRAHTNFRRRGFSLLELLVVGMVGTLLMLFMANAMRWYARSVQTTQISLRLTRELKIAAEAIAQDFGPAVAARTVDGTTLEINNDGGVADGVAQWAAPDSVVEYSIASDRLVRRDVTTGEEIPLADHITDLEAEVVDGKLQVRLKAKVRSTEHVVTLQLEGS
jgi:Tfp pilus assembly protein FimT